MLKTQHINKCCINKSQNNPSQIQQQQQQQQQQWIIIPTKNYSHSHNAYRSQHPTHHHIYKTGDHKHDKRKVTYQRKSDQYFTYIPQNRKRDLCQDWLLQNCQRAKKGKQYCPFAHGYKDLDTTKVNWCRYGKKCYKARSYQCKYNHDIQGLE